MTEATARRLRLYHFGATLVAIGIVLWALYWIKDVETTTSSNLRETYCNQGILTLATLDVWDEDNMSRCHGDLLAVLRERYQ